MELSGYLAVARRWWWTLLVATWVAAFSGYLVASQIPPTYEARAQLLVGPYNTDSDTLRAAGQLVQTYAELVTTRPLLESAIAEEGADMSAGELRSATRVTADDTTRFLSIRVQSTDPELAAKLANRLAIEISLLATRGTSLPEGQLQIVDEATPPSSAIAPQVSLIVGLAALAALLGALVLVMLVEYLSATVRTEDDLQQLTGVPFLGRVDTAKSLPRSHRALVDSVPESAAAASYRLVVAKASVREGLDPARSIVTVGTGADSATGQVAANLAAIAARGGRRVILIDADSADAYTTRIFGLTGQAGLSDLAEDPGRPPTDALAEISSKLSVIPAGTASDADAIEVDQAQRILESLAGRADLVIVATGPLHLTAATLVWARAADAAVIVAVRDRSRRDDVTYAVESLRIVGVRIRGTVLAERHRGIAGRPARSGNQTADLTVPQATTPVTHQARYAPAEAAAAPASGGSGQSTATGGGAGSAGPRASGGRAASRRRARRAQPPAS